MDVYWYLKRLWASITGILIGAYLVSMAPSASSATFNNCIPNQDAWSFIGNPQEKEIAKKRETLRCNKENSVLDEWSKRLSNIDSLRTKISTASNSGNWKEFVALVDESKIAVYEIQKQATSNPEIPGASSIRSLLGEELNYLFQNVGLSSPTSLEDAFLKIESASKENEQQSKASTLISSLLNQVHNRGIELAINLSKDAGNKIREETIKEKQFVNEQRKDKLHGRTVNGYFGGFIDRLINVWRPWLFILLVVTFLGAWLGIKNKINPVTAATAAGLSYLAPGTVMAGAFILLPFLPEWLMVTATLAGTVATYFYANQIFTWLARKSGLESPTAKRLLLIGKTLENLRLGFAPHPNRPTGTTNQSTVPFSTHGSARWGTSDEILKNGHIHMLDSSISGLALARVKDAKPGYDQRFKYVGHVITVAPNGSGKGIGAVIPNLLEYPGSCLVLDVKGENAAVTARARQEMGQKVYHIDPFKVNGNVSAAFNVLDRINLSDADCVSESAMLADSLVISEGQSSTSEHFDESAKTLIQGMILHVANLEPEDRHLGELRRLLTSDEETFLITLAEMASDETLAFGIPARAANTLMGMADRERGSVLSTARRNTAFLDDPRIAQALSRSDFDLAAIKEDLMTVYLVMPANKITNNSRFVRLFIGTVIASITASSKQPPHRVTFVLDEFAQLGYMKAIEDAVSLMRGYGLAFWVFLQDLSQLKGVYPRWQTFMANSAKVFFGTDDYDTAKYISDSLGQTTIEYETQNEGKNSGTGLSGGGGSMNRGKSAGSSQQFTGRHLLTPDEVMRLGPERPIVLVKGEYPYQLTRLNYLIDSEYVGKADPNPYHS